MEGIDYMGPFIWQGGPNLIEYTNDAVPKLGHPVTQTKLCSVLSRWSILVAAIHKNCKMKLKFWRRPE